MMAGKYRIILIKKKTSLVHFITQIVSRLVKDQENLFFRLLKFISEFVEVIVIYIL